MPASGDPYMSAESRPALTVVMPLYNKEKDVARAIKSIVHQSIDDWELIVVNDGSTDSSAQQVERISDPRVLLVNQANAGVAAARNAGVHRARSEFVSFLDADDEWDKDMVATLLLLKQEYPSARVLATGYRLRQSSDGLRDIVIRGLPAEFEMGLLEDYFGVAAQSDPPICSSTVAIERGALGAVGGFPAGVVAGEDLLTWAKLAAHYPIAYARRAHATIWPPEVAAGPPKRRPAEPDTVAAAIAKLHVRGRNRYLAHWHRMRGMHYLQLQEGRNARQEFLRAIGRNPTEPILWALLCVGLLPGLAALALYRKFKERQRGQSGRAQAPPEQTSGEI
jgi:cellulose synthase/poly-beta-1,6-N-acetylglucosamine synthase-like glycosyltransferase